MRPSQLGALVSNMIVAAAVGADRRRSGGKDGRVVVGGMLGEGLGGHHKTLKDAMAAIGNASSKEAYETVQIVEVGPGEYDWTGVTVPTRRMLFLITPGAVFHGNLSVALSAEACQGSPLPPTYVFSTVGGLPWFATRESMFQGLTIDGELAGAVVGLVGVTAQSLTVRGVAEGLLEVRDGAVTEILATTSVLQLHSAEVRRVSARSIQATDTQFGGEIKLGGNLTAHDCRFTPGVVVGGMGEVRLDACSNYQAKASGVQLSKGISKTVISDVTP